MFGPLSGLSSRPVSDPPSTLDRPPAPRPRTAGRRIPMPVKILYTAFAAILVPTYLHHYGPTNFLYFCDQSILLTLVGIWLESPLLIAMCAVGLVAPQLLWVLDALGSAVGHPVTGMTAYMFDARTPLYLRALSGFHGWLPFLLLYLVGRLGYDPRALPAWSALAVLTLLACFFLMPPPNPDPGLTPVNINYVWGMSDRAAQTWVPAWGWLTGLIVGLPALLFLPTHLALRRWAPAPAPSSPARP